MKRLDHETCHEHWPGHWQSKGWVVGEMMGAHYDALFPDLPVPGGFRDVHIQSLCENHPGSPEEGQAVMYNAFIGMIVGVGEERKPACRQ